jgi:2'-5' RNA ligase
MTTIGVAIAVPEPWAGELRQHRASFGDPLAAAIPAHVTLVPPTVVDDRLDTIEQHLSAVAAEHGAFGLRMRGTATFRPTSPVVFLSVVEGISSCELLAEAAREGPLSQEQRFPYHPHVTVAHHVDDEALDRAVEALADYECSFPVTDFHLYVHGDDGVWRPEHTYFLSGPADAPEADRRPS